jgi:hypothetical protein
MSDRKRDGSKLTFSERDKLRRERRSGSSGDGRGGRRERSAERYAQKSYRAALERAFDSGTLEELRATLQRTRDPLAGSLKTAPAPAPAPTSERQPPDAGSAEDGQDEAAPRPQRKPAVDRTRQERRALLKAILEAETPRDASHAIDKYINKFKELPSDYEILEKALSHTDAAVVTQVLEKLAACIAKSRPRRSRSLSVQLSILEDAHDDDDVRRLAAKIRAAL